MPQPDDPGPCGEASEASAARLGSIAWAADILRGGVFRQAWPVPTAAAPQPVPGSLPTAAELAYNATYASMPDVRRQT